ncbi:MAG TPA: cytochrome c oxidase subunit II [Acidimicrobiales bacterium]|nr:cytochrome c oxidase subunit II [Acidimicrobiales bacterium]
MQVVVIAVIGTAILIPLALIVPWFPTNASRQAGNVHTLYHVLLIATVPIFVIVETIVVYSVWKFRMRPGEELKDGPPIHGNTRLEVVWTALPALLIIGMCAYAYTVLRSNEDSKKGEMTVNVTARQFAFEYSYPNQDGKTVVSSALYLPNDRPVVFKLRSLDVIHSFFVPEFSEKLDAVPGITTTLRVTPTRLGTYPVECTELCGAGHSLMRSTAYVVSPAKFQSWLAAQPANAPPPIGTPSPKAVQPGVPGSPSGSSAAPAPPATAGTTPAPSSTATAAAAKAVFTGIGGCGACHTLAAAGTSGTIGPNLDVRLRTDCASAASKAVRGAALDQCIRTAIVSPYKFIPSGYSAGIMPANFAQRLTPTQIQSLVTFLASVAK